MSTKLSIRILATIPSPAKKEFVASEIELSHFSPDVLDVELGGLLASAVRVLDRQGFSDPKSCRLEIAVLLSSDEGVRPALHLSRSVVDQLAVVGATLDFDPYC
jgi:hypothetical protein